MSNNPAGRGVRAESDGGGCMKFWRMRLLTGLLAAMLALGALAGCAEEKPGLDVVASFYPMADFAEKIGGDRVNVTTMVPSGAEPHDWEPSPSDIVTLTRADVFVYNGAGMEHWAEDVLNSLNRPDLIRAEASRGVTLLEGHGDGAEGGAHAGDPHVWLDPMNAKTEMANIRDAFVGADPEGEAVYDANYEKYAAALDALDAEYRAQLGGLENRDVVVAHAAFAYLCHAYNLNQVAIEGLTPDSEPDPARVAGIIDFAKEHAVRVIFFEELVSPKVAQSIAAQAGASTDVLSPIEGLSDEEAAAGGDYFSVMRKNLKALVAALE